MSIEDVLRRQDGVIGRDQALAAGWTVLRFTWHDLTEYPARVIAAIRSALRQAA